MPFYLFFAKLQFRFKFEVGFEDFFHYTSSGCGLVSFIVVLTLLDFSHSFSSDAQRDREIIVIMEMSSPTRTIGIRSSTLSISGLHWSCQDEEDHNKSKRPRDAPRRI